MSHDESLKNIARNLIQHVDRSKLIDLASATTFLGRDELESMQDPTAYIERIFVVAIEPPSFMPQGPVISSVFFSIGVTEDNQPSYPQAAFEASNSAIYATFSTVAPNASGSVIVRWFNNAENKMIAFNRSAVNAGQHNHYTWVQPHGGWLPGDYSVAIYDDNESVDLLAAGYFYVVAAQ